VYILLEVMITPNNKPQLKCYIFLGYIWLYTLYNNGYFAELRESIEKIDKCLLIFENGYRES